METFKWIKEDQTLDMKGEDQVSHRGPDTQHEMRSEGQASQRGLNTQQERSKSQVDHRRLDT